MCSSDLNAYLENAKAAVKADEKGKARVSAYNYPLATTLLTGAVHCTFDILGGKTTAENMAERVAMRVNDAATSDSFTIKAYSEKFTNVFVCYSEGYVAF